MKLLDLFIEMFTARKKPHELEIGVPRPTYVLAGLVKQKMLLDPDALEYLGRKYDSTTILKWEKDGISFQWKGLWNFEESLGARWRMNESTLHLSVNGKAIDASTETDYLLAALKEVYFLKKERIKNKAFYDAQLAATEAIEHIMIGTSNENRTSQRSTPRVLPESTPTTYYTKIPSTHISGGY